MSSAPPVTLADAALAEPTHLTIRPLSVRIGAEILGVDLTRPLDDATFAQIHQALIRYQVIFFRDQHLDFHSHAAFAGRFGPVDKPDDPGTDPLGPFRVAGFPEIVTIHTDANSTYIAGEDWHTDMSCLAQPPLGSMLYLHTVPAIGGDTVFASMYDAYDTLSARMKAHLEGLTAVHDAAPGFGSIVDDPGIRFPKAVHPVIRTHPESGRRALYVNKGFTTKIVELPGDESKALLDYLFQHIAAPQFQMRFKWQPHSIALWDNRCTQHIAIWDYFPQVRSGYRVTICGDTPV